MLTFNKHWTFFLGSSVPQQINKNIFRICFLQVYHLLIDFSSSHNIPCPFNWLSRLYIRYIYCSWNVSIFSSTWIKYLAIQTAHLNMANFISKLIKPRHLLIPPTFSAPQFKKVTPCKANMIFYLVPPFFPVLFCYLYEFHMIRKNAKSL